MRQYLRIKTDGNIRSFCESLIHHLNSNENLLKDWKEIKQLRIQGDWDEFPRFYLKFEKRFYRNLGLLEIKPDLQYFDVRYINPKFGGKISDRIRLFLFSEFIRSLSIYSEKDLEPVLLDFDPI